MKNYLPLLTACLLLLDGCSNRDVNPEITTGELKNHVTYLASDELGGRYPGTDGARKAAEYIRKNLAAAGLELPADSGYQSFPVVVGQKKGDHNTLEINSQQSQPGVDFEPMPFSGNGEHTAPVVFAGYGLKRDGRGITWNDYEGVDVSGRWVMVLRGAPYQGQLKKQFMGQTKDRSKATLAKDLGAAGLLFVSGPRHDSADYLVNPHIKKGDIGIPALHIKRSIANKMLPKTSIRELENSINREGKPNSFSTNQQIRASAQLFPEKATARNVVAHLKPANAGTKERYIVIGGHYDHLGMGGPNTGSRRPDTSAVHNGADDNASGIAAMIELAEKLSAMRDSLRSHFIFVAFDAEEMGLLGSRHFVQTSPYDYKDYHAMINLDMIGRLRNENSLQIGGVGTAKESQTIIRQINDTAAFTLGLSQQGYGPSDHASFYTKNIPVFFLSTGPHLDYHTPADDADKLNYPGMKKVSGFVYSLALRLDNMDSRLAFQQAGPQNPDQQARHGEEMKATLGIMPDFAGVVKKGLRADLVIESKAADRAGMENGDIITAINGNEVGDIYDYMERMSDFKPGETITVEILRNGRQKVLMVQL